MGDPAVIAVLESIYNDLGADGFFSNGEYIGNCIYESVPDSAEIAGLMRQIIDSGIGRLYMPLILNGTTPGGDFYVSVYSFMNSIGIPDVTANRLIQIMNNVFGWIRSSGNAVFTSKCGKCGSMNTGNAAFCRVCGAMLNDFYMPGPGVQVNVSAPNETVQKTVHKKNKKSLWIVPGIAAAMLIVGAAVFFILKFALAKPTVKKKTTAERAAVTATETTRAGTAASTTDTSYVNIIETTDEPAEPSTSAVTHPEVATTIDSGYIVVDQSFYYTQKDGTEQPGKKTIDGQYNTAWNVRADRIDGPITHGVGAWLDFYFPSNTQIYSVTIYPGFLKSEKIFKMNYIPTDITIASGGRSFNVDLSDYAGDYKKAKQGYTLMIPDWLVLENGKLRITINDVYNFYEGKPNKVMGTDYFEDCCISEVTFTGCIG